MRTDREKKNMQYVMQIRTVLVAFAICFFIGVFMPNSSKSYKVAITLWIVAFVFMFVVYNPLYSKKYKVFVRGNMLFVLSGVLIYSKKAIQLSNIQYIKQSQGLIQKLFYQYTVVVYTAGGTIYASGLSLENAQRLQKKLLSWREGDGA
ncbi:MAG: PH domain-containing protein [Oscillospiraceae bacterium]